MKLKKIAFLALIMTNVFLKYPSDIVYADEIVRTQAQLIEYVYDANNRLVEIRKGGNVIAVFNYDKNGNLLSINIVS